MQHTDRQSQKNYGTEHPNRREEGDNKARGNQDNPPRDQDLMNDDGRETMDDENM